MLVAGDETDANISNNAAVSRSADVLCAPGRISHSLASIYTGPGLELDPFNGFALFFLVYATIN